MYLSKPIDGFCVPVLYVEKEYLNINELKDIKTMDYDNGIFFRSDNLRDSDYTKKSNVSNKDGIEYEKISKKLIFDEDENSNTNELEENIIRRKVEEIDEKNLGLLILDGDVDKDGEDY